MEPKIVPYSTARRQEIVDLLNVCLARKLTGERDVDYWAWKHEQNPFGPSILLLAEGDGRLAGVRAFLRWRLCQEGQTLDVAKPVDTVTHPDYQRRGIFTKLTLAACDYARAHGIGFLFNTPNANSRPGYLKLGWREVGGLPLHVKVLRPLRAAARAVGWKLRGGRVPPVAAFFRQSPEPAATVFREDQAVADLLASQPPSAAWATHRTLDWLRWRYELPPHIPYFVETVRSHGQLQGILFYRTNFRHGLREVMIDDVLLRGNGSCDLKDLVRQLRDRVCAEYLLAHVAETSPLGVRWRQVGFHRLPGRGVTLVARKLDERVVPDPYQPRNWSLCFGDLEGL